MVFLLNRYFRATGQAIEAAGGRVDKFIGDGVMAIFGLGTDPQTACRQALDAARRMALALDDLNEAMSGDLDLPFRIGIGLHAGPAIVGEMGYERAAQITAIGDTVNTASRLETLTKEFGAELVVSQELLDRAGVDPRGPPPRRRDPGASGPVGGTRVQERRRTHGNVIRISLPPAAKGKNSPNQEADHALDPNRLIAALSFGLAASAFAAGGGGGARSSPPPSPPIPTTRAPRR